MWDHAWYQIGIKNPKVDWTQTPGVRDLRRVGIEPLPTCLCNCSGHRTFLHNWEGYRQSGRVEFFSMLMRYLDSLEPSANDFPFLSIPLSFPQEVYNSWFTLYKVYLFTPTPNKEIWTGKDHPRAASLETATGKEGLCLKGLCLLKRVFILFCPLGTRYFLQSD